MVVDWMVLLTSPLLLQPHPRLMTPLEQALEA